MTDNDSVNVRELREKIVRLGPWHHDVEVLGQERRGEELATG